VLALKHERLKEDRSRERRYGALTALERALGLTGVPVRIEGFDISNLGGEDIVASMVVFEGGTAKKSDYRKFSIRTTAGQDDTGAMREVLLRRFTRGREGPCEGEYDPSFEAVPDLIMVDGGRPQLGAARGALREAGVDGAVSVVALAKREEEVFVPWSPDPLGLAQDDPGLLLLRSVRDEAHRFALGYHRNRRMARTTQSLLDQLPGIGEKRKKAIIKHFGSPERFLEASREEVEAVPGLPGKVAREVYAYVHKTG
jgi:excinuclease ABC subunit C